MRNGFSFSVKIIVPAAATVFLCASVSAAQDAAGTDSTGGQTELASALLSYYFNLKTAVNEFNKVANRRKDAVKSRGKIYFTKVTYIKYYHLTGEGYDLQI